MMLSTRADPPRFLNIPKAQNGHSKVKQFLLHSPLPSPSLPSILPRHGKKPPRLNTRKALRVLCWLSILTLTIWIYQMIPRIAFGLDSLVYQLPPGMDQSIGKDLPLPKSASPIAVVDARGRSRWTVSIPKDRHFPLPATDYDAVCSRVEEVSRHVASERRNVAKIEHLQYHDADPNYLDIADAQQSGLLPTANVVTKLSSGHKVCEKSLTYVLDASEAGLGDALLGLWMSYGLAQSEGRAFFVDYSGFAYGKLTALFAQVPPAPECRPPPWEQRTPCPHYAKHLVVGASTLRWTFGSSFQKAFSTKQTFEMARRGYEDLFELRDDDKRYVESRLVEQRSMLGKDGLLVGMHIRRGDRHPFEFQYQHGYLPPSKYIGIAHDITKSHPDSVLMLASDDADIYHHPELEGIVRAQDKIRLASKKHTNHGGLGWEGGFFKDAFWDIGLPEYALKQKYIGSPDPSRKKGMTVPADVSDRQRNYKSQPTKEALQLREYIGRAYMLDLAMLAGSDEVICGVSSKGCRLLAIMMGWDKLHKGHWRNIDGDYGWRALFE